tara:strand:- start:1616 stop:1741 length:126 start_codon:yes stop_codon:yes gene_type:complete
MSGGTDNPLRFEETAKIDAPSWVLYKYTTYSPQQEEVKTNG